MAIFTYLFPYVDSFSWRVRDEKTEIKWSLLLIVKTSHLHSWGISCQRHSEISQTFLHEKVGNLVQICITEALQQKISVDTVVYACDYLYLDESNAWSLEINTSNFLNQFLYRLKGCLMKWVCSQSSSAQNSAIFCR